MDWINSIQKIIDYIDEHLDEELNIDELAKSIYTSKYYFQKMFVLLCGCTVGEYIRNRRMTTAGIVVQNETTSIIDIAIKFRYETNESFTRAFTRFHEVTPSIARKTRCNLNTFSPITVKSNISGGKEVMNDFSKRGYVVKETGAIYYTEDMDNTLKWFKDVLGWFGQIDSRDDNNIGTYGCVDNIPMEISGLHIAPFTGIHMFKGEPIKRMISFMLVSDVQKLYDFVKDNDWNEITEVEKEPWGGKICSVTTVDGSILRFFDLG